MMTSDGPSRASWSEWRRRLTAPRSVLAMLLVAAAAVHFMPDRFVDPLRGALVVDGGAKMDSLLDRASPLLDAGADLGLRSGRVVLSGRRVWGKLATVGPHTSVVQRITDRGYRDAVQLVRRDAGADAPG